MDLSLFLTIPTIPVAKAATPDVAARIPVTVSVILLKNVAPPLWPEAIKRCINTNNNKKAATNLTDHLPDFVCGKNDI